MPIVVGLSLFDLAVGDPRAARRRRGYAAACRAARGRPDRRSGPVGAGTGATVGKWRGPRARPARRARARRRCATATWSWRRCVAVNATGDIDDGPDVAASADLDRSTPRPTTAVDGPVSSQHHHRGRGHQRRLDKTGACVVAKAATTAWPGRCSRRTPRVDGDALVAAATGGSSPAGSTGAGAGRRRRRAGDPRRLASGRRTAPVASARAHRPRRARRRGASTCTRCELAAGPHPGGVRHGRPARRPDVHRRGPGRRGGPAGPPVRRAARASSSTS